MSARSVTLSRLVGRAAATLLLVGLAATPAPADIFHPVAAGGGVTWQTSDELTISAPAGAGAFPVNGLPGVGATINGGNSGTSGSAINDLGMWVNGAFVGGLLTVTGTTANFSTVSLSGLDTTIQFHFLATEGTARILLSMHNPSGAAISPTVDFAANFTMDATTAVVGSSTGDTTFDTSDRWVTHDSSAGGTTFTNTTVMAGPGAAVVPSAVSGTVFNNTGTQGVRATYGVTVPPGETRRVMLFVHWTEFSSSLATALAEAAIYDSNATLTAEHLTGITAAAQSEIVNWAFAGSTISVTCPAPPAPVAADATCTWSGSVGGFSVLDSAVAYPADLTVQVNADAPVTAAGALAADGPFSITFGGASPFAALPVGSNTVIVSVENGNGDQDSCTTTVAVTDSAPPTVTCSLGRRVLLPASNGLLDVSLFHSVADCDPAAGLVGLQVFSDEPDAGAPYTPDVTWNGTTLRLRAERSSLGNGRVYVVRVTVQDASLNQTTTCCSAVVPLNATIAKISQVLAEAATAEATCPADPAGLVEIFTVGVNP